jgi:hypothetical protein
LLARRQAKPSDNRRDDFFNDETESDFLVLVRAWQYAERASYDDERCRRIGIHAQAARQVGRLFEQFLSIAAAEGFDISEKPAAQDVKDAVQRCVRSDLPIMSPNVWMPVRCAANWCMAAGAYWRLKASSKLRSLLWRRRARWKAALPRIER